jgi:hypothetical protein
VAFRQRLIAQLILRTLYIAPVAAQQDPQKLLSDVSRKVADTIHRIPNYMCTETVERKRSAPAVLGTGSCAELAAESRRLRLTSYPVSSDRLRLDVAVGSGTEMYSWVGQDRFSDRGITAVVNSGAISTGAFAGFLDEIFGGGDRPEISYRGAVNDAGRPLFEFLFRVPYENSHYFYSAGTLRAKVAYDGTFRLDPTSEDLAQLVLHAGDLPAETPACEVTQSMDYGRTRIGASDLLLPREFQMQIVHRDGSEIDERAVFSNCHEFLGKSTISFEDPDKNPKVPSGTARTPQPATNIPAGLPFRLALATPIDTAVAATGDPVRARLATAIRDNGGKVLAPAGTIVTGRIFQMLFTSEPTTRLKLTIRWESILRGGETLPFAATQFVPEKQTTPDGSNTRFRQGGLKQRVDLGQLTPAEPPVEPLSNFVIERATPGFVLRVLDSNWITVAR